MYGSRLDQWIGRLWHELGCIRTSLPRGERRRLARLALAKVGHAMPPSVRCTPKGGWHPPTYRATPGQRRPRRWPWARRGCKPRWRGLSLKWWRRPSPRDRSSQQAGAFRGGASELPLSRALRGGPAPWTERSIVMDLPPSAPCVRDGPANTATRSAAGVLLVMVAAT